MARIVNPARIALAITLSVLASSASYSSPVYKGAVCSQNVSRLTNEIAWTRSFKDAQDEAVRDDKLILWIHMVGKLDGFT